MPVVFILKHSLEFSFKYVILSLIFQFFEMPRLSNFFQLSAHFPFVT